MTEFSRLACPCDIIFVVSQRTCLGTCLCAFLEIIRRITLRTICRDTSETLHTSTWTRNIACLLTQSPGKLIPITVFTVYTLFASVIWILEILSWACLFTFVLGRLKVIMLRVLEPTSLTVITLDCALCATLLAFCACVFFCVLIIWTCTILNANATHCQIKYIGIV